MENFTKKSLNGDYGACVEAVDWATKCLLHEFRKCGIEKNTLIIFTSDNGSRGDNGSSNYPLKGTKGTTWEGGIRLPCILHWPGHISPGRVCGDILSSIDFLPTFAALCGVTLNADVIIDGFDFSELLTNINASSKRKTFFYYFKNDLEAVREGDWKLHVRKRVIREGEYDIHESIRGEEMRGLYNLRDDIGEENNLYTQNPEIVRRLEKLLEQCRIDLGDAALGIKGKRIRPIGRVENPKPLTEYDENHPYIVAVYDRPECG